MSEPRKVKRTNFLVKGFNALMTLDQWERAGYPVRDPEDVKAIFATHCSGCPLYTPEGQAIPFGPRGLCDDALEIDGAKGCGCHVSPDAEELTNALTVPFHPCPLGKFGHEQLGESE